MQTIDKKLIKKQKELRWEKSDSPQSFDDKLNGLETFYAECGKELSNAEKKRLLMALMPGSYFQCINDANNQVTTRGAIEHLKHLSDIMYSTNTNDMGSVDSKLQELVDREYMYEELLAQMSILYAAREPSYQKSNNNNGSTANGNSNCEVAPGGVDGQSNNSNSNNNNNNNGQQDRHANLDCFNCGKKGHIKANCPEK